MAVKYSGLLRFTDEIKAEINLAADGTVEKAVVIDGDGVETPIGGSTSDYTTATVAITNNLSDDVSFGVPYITELGSSVYSQSIIAVAPSTTETLTVVLYKGVALCDVLTSLSGATTTATGDISGVYPTFEISGNGTITVAAK